ncbi:hypothetical protein WMY93_012164 [Mugilogobius chulae]|uniref:Uncharacterized protein n=1 Tax=Mugilogobius chulae TaxID=88201 RepID=A0AAW0PGU0_9GOBI
MDVFGHYSANTKTQNSITRVRPKDPTPESDPKIQHQSQTQRSNTRVRPKDPTPESDPKIQDQNQTQSSNTRARPKAPTPELDPKIQIQNQTKSSRARLKAPTPKPDPKFQQQNQTKSSRQFSLFQVQVRADPIVRLGRQRLIQSSPFPRRKVSLMLWDSVGVSLGRTRCRFAVGLQPYALGQSQSAPIRLQSHRSDRSSSAALTNTTLMQM